MEKYELKPSDYKWLDRVVKNSTSIENRYQALYELEVSGQKDSDEYKKQMEYLSLALEVEERQYEEAGLNFAKCGALANYILSDRVHDDFLSDNESIAMMDFRDSSLRRIVNNLKSKMYTCYDDIQSELPPVLNDFLRFMGESDPRQKISDDIYASIQIQ